VLILQQTYFYQYRVVKKKVPVMSSFFYFDIFQGLFSNLFATVRHIFRSMYIIKTHKISEFL